METIGRWLSHIESRLDQLGKPAWIAAMVVAFIFIWPLGLIILGYMIWSGRMACGHKDWRNRWTRGHKVAAGTGNAAFDEYRESTLRRLQEEQEAFVSFLARLRKAKDKAEFDQFMADRSRPDRPGEQSDAPDRDRTETADRRGPSPEAGPGFAPA